MVRIKRVEPRRRRIAMYVTYWGFVCAIAFGAQLALRRPAVESLISAATIAFGGLAMVWLGQWWEAGATTD
jgi:hypothetical protein